VVSSGASFECFPLIITVVVGGVAYVSFQIFLGYLAAQLSAKWWLPLTSICEWKWLWVQTSLVSAGDLCFQVSRLKLISGFWGWHRLAFPHFPRQYSLGLYVVVSCGF